jgi:hypothetical protein
MLQRVVSGIEESSDSEVRRRGDDELCLAGFAEGQIELPTWGTVAHGPWASLWGCFGGSLPLLQERTEYRFIGEAI